MAGAALPLRRWPRSTVSQDCVAPGGAPTEMRRGIRWPPWRCRFVRWPRTTVPQACVAPGGAPADMRRAIRWLPRRCRSVVGRDEPCRKLASRPGALLPKCGAGFNGCRRVAASSLAAINHAAGSRRARGRSCRNAARDSMTAAALPLRPIPHRITLRCRSDPGRDSRLPHDRIARRRVPADSRRRKFDRHDGVAASVRCG